jgi:hypothetical protein
MLVLVPAGAGLDAAAEKAGLAEALAGLEKEVELTVLEGAVTGARISDALVEQRFHVLHFIGHGGFRDEEAFLVLNDAAGEPAFVGQTEFAGLIADHPTLKLVVLNSCQGATLSSTQPLVGMAAGLVKRGLPAVVAMQYPIRDRQAVLFAREFYRCLFRGWSRGWIEVAVSHARRRLEIEFPGDRAMATPVLFTRAPEGVLFDLVSGNLLRDAPFSPRRLSTVRALARAHEHDVDVLSRTDEASASGPEAARALDEVRRRIRFRNVSLATAAGVALLTVLLSWIYAFDRLPAALKVESYTVWMAEGFIHRTFDERIALVAIERDPRERLVDTEPGAKRREYARLIDGLSARGAAAVAFDLYFEKETPADGELAAAIRRARERGTVVVLGLANVPHAAPPAILREAGAEWASLCAGRRGTKSAALVPLLAAPAGGTALTPALSLAAMTALDGARAVDIDAGTRASAWRTAGDGGFRPWRASWVDPGSATRGCAAIDAVRPRGPSSSWTRHAGGRAAGGGPEAVLSGRGRGRRRGGTDLSGRPSSSARRIPPTCSTSSEGCRGRGATATRSTPTRSTRSCAAWPSGRSRRPASSRWPARSPSSPPCYARPRWRRVPWLAAVCSRRRCWPTWARGSSPMRPRA